MTLAVPTLALALAVAQVLASPFRDVPDAADSPFRDEPAREATLQARLTRLAVAGDVEGAVLARAELRRLRYANPPAVAESADVRAGPDTVDPLPSEVGQEFLFRLDAARAGRWDPPAYGTDVYTGGSGLRAAAEHAGAVLAGESAVVRVTVLPGQARYEASTRNGVSSRAWGRWGVSFKVERVTPPSPATP